MIIPKLAPSPPNFSVIIPEKLFVKIQNNLENYACKKNEKRPLGNKLNIQTDGGTETLYALDRTHLTLLWLSEQYVKAPALLEACCRIGQLRFDQSSLRATTKSLLPTESCRNCFPSAIDLSDQLSRKGEVVFGPCSKTSQQSKLFSS